MESHKWLNISVHLVVFITQLISNILIGDMKVKNDNYNESQSQSITMHSLNACVIDKKSDFNIAQMASG
jgi:hypothetical protein